MRVLIAAHGYPPSSNGGAELRAARTARALAERGHTVRVFTTTIERGLGAELHWTETEQDGVIVRRLHFAPAPSDPATWEYDNPHIARALDTLFGEWRPDVVHLFSGYLLSSSVVRAAVTSHLPIVVSLTDFWWLCRRINLVQSDGNRCAGPTVVGCARCRAEELRRYRQPAQLWPRAVGSFWHVAESLAPLGNLLGLPHQELRARTLLETLRAADRLIAPSQHLAEIYIRHGIDPTRMLVWRQGVKLDRCPVRRPSSMLRVGYLGQMKHHKGVHLLLEAWTLLRDDRPRQLVLYGSDAGEEAYGRRLREMLLHAKGATWDGEFHGPDLWSLLADLDVVVVPSRWIENSPNVILEAQALGVPIVGSNLGGVSELVQHEHNGLLFTADDAGNLACQIQRLLDEEGLLERLRGNPLPFRALDEEIDRLEVLYAELTAGTAL